MKDTNAESTPNYNTEPLLDLGNVINWAKIEDNEYPKDEWLIIETSDKGHHIAYYSSVYKKWECNSKFGGELIWWAIVPSAPCL